MSNNKENASVNRQNHPRQEGQQNNTPPVQQGEYQGQRHGENHNQPMSNMMQESEEQKAGRAHGQKDESGVQQDERMP
jgi:hypothetical protein